MSEKLSFLKNLGEPENADLRVFDFQVITYNA